MKEILRVEDIYKSYARPRKADADFAVKGASLALQKGTVLGLVGESGCGKSTLAGIIVRLIKEDRGCIFFEGQNVTDINGAALRKFRKSIQIVFQDIYGALNPSKKIGWLLKECLDIWEPAMPSIEKEEQVEEMLYTVGLSSKYKNRYPHELSGGERQRAGIAMALMLKPKVLIADEAVSALDVSVQAQILNLMAELKEKLDLSYLFISHDLNVVNYISDHIAVMQAGEIVEMGTASAVFHSPATAYTKRLINAIPKL